MSESFDRAHRTEKPLIPESFPTADAFVGKYAKRPQSSPERVAGAKEILRAFLEEEVKNTDLYRSESHDAAYPYTFVRVEDVARKLFEKYGGAVAPKEKDEIEIGRPKLEFVIGGFQLFTRGHEYEYAEFPMSAVMQGLPNALAALAAGREPVPHAIYTLGSPVSEVGNIGTAFAKDAQKEPLRALARLYAEQIQEAIRTTDYDHPSVVELEGVSVGSIIAAETANVLMKSGVVTQDVRDLETPRIITNMYLPVALDRSKSAAAQLGLGYIVEGGIQLIGDAGVRSMVSGTAAFIKEARAASGKELPLQMDGEQKLRKDAVMTTVQSRLLGGGISVPEGVKTTQIIGTLDPLMYSLARNQEVSVQRAAHTGSLGENFIPSRTDSNARVSAARMTHRVPFYRETEFRGWDKAADALTDLRKGK